MCANFEQIPYHPNSRDAWASLRHHFQFYKIRLTLEDVWFGNEKHKFRGDPHSISVMHPTNSHTISHLICARSPAPASRRSSQASHSSSDLLHSLYIMPDYIIRAGLFKKQPNLAIFSDILAIFSDIQCFFYRISLSSIVPIINIRNIMSVTDLLGCPSFANMWDACVPICCFFSFGGKVQHAWHFSTWGHVRILAQNLHVVGLVQNIV